MKPDLRYVDALSATPQRLPAQRVACHTPDRLSHGSPSSSASSRCGSPGPARSKSRCASGWASKSEQSQLVTCLPGGVAGMLLPVPLGLLVELDPKWALWSAVCSTCSVGFASPNGSATEARKKSRSSRCEAYMRYRLRRLHLKHLFGRRRAVASPCSGFAAQSLLGHGLLHPGTVFEPGPSGSPCRSVRPARSGKRPVGAAFRLRSANVPMARIPAR